MLTFWIFSVYGSWEAGDSVKILWRDVGTFSTIEYFILRTFIFRHFRPLGARPPKCDPPSETRVALSPNQPNLELNLSPDI